MPPGGVRLVYYSGDEAKTQLSLVNRGLFKSNRKLKENNHHQRAAKESDTANRRIAYKVIYYMPNHQKIYIRQHTLEKSVKYSPLFIKQL